MSIAFEEIIGKDVDAINTTAALSQRIIQVITSGLLAPGSKLPGVNQMAKIVGLNRLTVLKAMDELEIEGWVRKKPRSGTYVSENLPVNMPREIGLLQKKKKPLPVLTPAEISSNPQNFFRLSFNDGYPDYRLFPVKEVARAFSTAFKDNHDKPSLLYYDVYGQQVLRASLANYIYQTRNIKCSAEQLIVTRGSTLGIYLVAKGVCVRRDTVAMAEPGYRSARQAFVNEGLRVLSIQVDEQGLDTEHLKQVLKREKIKLLYVTPHHQYPTTVTLSAERRMELLKLAEQHNFYLLEDDYDFDFQYDRRPILPIASIDQLHRVIYIGGFSKALSPAIRLGYVLAGAPIIQEMGKWRRVIDRQGDSIQELAFAKLINDGVIEKAIRKAIKVYKERRDFTYSIFQQELSEVISLHACNGGLAFWAKFHRNPDEVEHIIRRAYSKELFIIPPARLLGRPGQYTRMGFASMDIDEIGEAVGLLKGSVV